MARRTRHSRRRGQLAWSAAKTDRSDLSAATTEEDVLVTGTDWAVSASQTGVLQTIHGTISMAKVSALGTDLVRMFILKVNFDQAIDADLNPATIQNYVDEDVLWSGLWQPPNQDSIVSTGNFTSWHVINVHVKAKRKLRGDDEIRFFISSAQGEVQYSTIWRSLTRVDT